MDKMCAFATHKELKEQVVIWVLVLKSDGSLLLQVDRVHQ